MPAQDIIIKSEDLIVLRAQLRAIQAGGGVRVWSAFRKRIKEAAEPARAAVAGAAGQYSSTLPAVARVQQTYRAKMAGATIMMDGGKLTGHTPLPRMIEGKPGGGGYRHPVFDRGGWATQRPHPYFYSTLNAQAGQLETNVGHVVDDVLEMIAGRA